MKKLNITLILAAILAVAISCSKQSEYKALIVTGQANHDCKISSTTLKTILNLSGKIDAYIAVTPASGEDMSKFNPGFSKYDVVVLDYNGDNWSEKTRKAFIEYVNNGGGVVVYRESLAAFPDWTEYREICGLNGSPAATEAAGPYVFFRGNKVYQDSSAGPTGTFGAVKETEVRIRKPDHPVTKGLAVRWVHADDQIINRLRGNGEKIDVLATQFADTSAKGPGREVPVAYTVKREKGRVLVLTMGMTGGDGGPAMKCSGFITMLQRGAEWAASGEVTQPVPNDFPTASGSFTRPDYTAPTIDIDFANIITYETGKSTRYYTDIQARLREAAGDQVKLQDLEKRMTAVLMNKNATAESKKLMLRELSWMGTDISLQAIKDLVNTEETREAAEFALERLGIK
ncbi:MAG: ThuA domain-containing protein [Bacteroidales bacterium]